MIATELTVYGRHFMWYKDNTELGEVGMPNALVGKFPDPFYDTGWFTMPLTAYGKLPF